MKVGLEEARIVSEESLGTATSEELRADELVGKKRISDSEDSIECSVPIERVSAGCRLMVKTSLCFDRIKVERNGVALRAGCDPSRNASCTGASTGASRGLTGIPVVRSDKAANQAWRCSEVESCSRLCAMSKVACVMEVDKVVVGVSG